MRTPLATRKNVTISSELSRVRRTAFLLTVLQMLACTGLLASCSKSVVVEADFPEPIVPSLPLRVGLRYGEALKNYSYTEELPSDGTWEFALGETNAKLFDKIFTALFDEVIHVDATGGSQAPYTELDAVIEPTLETFEFSVPRQSRSDQYSVWIRYNIRVYAPDQKRNA